MKCSIVDIHTHRPTGKALEPSFAGIHPWQAETRRIEEIVPRFGEVDLVGEIGLDYYLEHLDRDAQQALGMKEGFDVGLEMSGAPPAVSEMIDNMNHGGKVAMLGLPKNPYPIDWGKVITHMLTIKGIYGREMFETWYLMTSMLSTSPTLADAVRSVITHRFPAEQWQQAFDVARSGNCGKVILDWS